MRLSAAAAVCCCWGKTAKVKAQTMGKMRMMKKKRVMFLACVCTVSTFQTLDVESGGSACVSLAFIFHSRWLPDVYLRVSTQLFCQNFSVVSHCIHDTARSVDELSACSVAAVCSIESVRCRTSVSFWEKCVNSS